MASSQPTTSRDRHISRLINSEHVELRGVSITKGKEIGRGSYGTVYEVTVNGTLAAAKEMHQNIKSERNKQKFLDECVYNCKLLHPNIVQLLGIYYPSPSGELPWLVMELLHISLSGLIEKQSEREKDIPFHFKLSILMDTCEGLRFLHNKSIIHRDLSSNNILLTKHLVAKIADFGLVKVLHKDPQVLTQIPGTPAFMPPEAFLDNPEYDSSLDVFSLGCVCIHLVSLEFPTPVPVKQLDAETGKIIQLQLTEFQRRSKYFKNIEQMPKLKRLVEQCLMDSSKDRPAIGEIVDKLKKIHYDPLPHEKDDILQLYTSLIDCEKQFADKEQELAKEKDKISKQFDTLNKQCIEMDWQTAKHVQQLQVCMQQLKERYGEVVEQSKELNEQLTRNAQKIAEKDRQIAELTRQLEIYMQQLNERDGEHVIKTNEKFARNTQLAEQELHLIECELEKLKTTSIIFKVIPINAIELKFEGESYSMDEIPSEDSSIVTAEIRKINYYLSDYDDLAFGRFFGIVCHGLKAAGYEHTKEQIEILQLGFIFNKSALMVAKFKHASSSIFTNPQFKNMHRYFANNMDVIALETLSSVSHLAKEMEGAARELCNHFEAMHDKINAIELQVSKAKENEMRQIKLKKAEFTTEWHNDQEMAECAVGILHGIITALRYLSDKMTIVYVFWKEMADYCLELDISAIKSLIKRAIVLPENKRLRLLATNGFKMKIIKFYSGWVALNSVCVVYIKLFEKNQQDLYKYITENTTLEESKRIFIKMITDLKNEVDKFY